MAQARKLTDKRITGEYETQKYHILYFDLDESFLEGLFEDIMEDPEEAYSWGIIIDWDGEIYSITVDTLIPYLIREEYQDDEENKIEDYRKLAKILEPYKGYEIYVKRNKKEASSS